MKKITRMVSFDTSSSSTGYAYFENAVLKESGTIDLTNVKNSDTRFNKMCEKISAYSNQKKPHILIVEEPPFCNSPQTFKMLSEIVGVTRGYAIVKGEEQVEYPVNVWRKFIASPGESIPNKRDDCKKWDINKVETILKIKPKDDNEADAILIGIARVIEMLDLDDLEDYAKKFM